MKNIDLKKNGIRELSDIRLPNLVYYFFVIKVKWGTDIIFNQGINDLV